MHTSRIKAMTMAVIALCCLASPPVGDAHHLVRRVNLTEMTVLADRVFVGRCLSVEETEEEIAGGILPVTRYTFEVERAIKGRIPKQITIKYLGHATPALPILPVMADEKIPDDRESVQHGDLVLLIVEDDPHYARVLVDLARDAGFKVLAATNGADALALARQYQPTAISLDVFLPDMLGWTVLSQLKQDPATRHIPVQMITLDEDPRINFYANLPGTPPYEVPVGAAVAVTFEEVAPGRLIHEWRVID